MMPGEFSFDQSGIEENSTVIIQASDKIPFCISIGSELVVGGIMLNKLTDVLG